MIKVYSLDFLNNEFYDKDIISESGEIIFSANDQVTPDALLKLYFKNIYVQNPITENEIGAKNNHNKQKSENYSAASRSESRQIDSDNNESEQSESTTSDFKNVSTMETPIENAVVTTKVLEKPAGDCKKSFCDEIVEYSVKIGKLLELPTEEIQELEKLAYYYVIDTMDKPVPDNMEKLVNRCYKDYKTEEFSLDEKIPYQHIIFIVNYYVETLKQTQSKQKTIFKMLYLGTNKFNPFVLHKFLHMMQND